jgi:hypothetical protein
MLLRPTLATWPAQASGAAIGLARVRRLRMTPTWLDSSEMHVYANSRTLDPDALRSGRDVVLDIPLSHGLRVPEGVLIDDHLSRSQRRDIDCAARAAIEKWHARYDSVLAFGSLSVSDIWHSELFAEVFLPTARIMAGVRAAVASGGARQVVTHGLDPELAEALSVALAPIPVAACDAGPMQHYPGEDAAPKGTLRRAPRWQRLARALLDAVGLPSLVRGRLLIVSYYSTEPVLAWLAAGNGPSPVVYTAFPPPLDVAARAALRGGWTGLPGTRSLRRAASLLDRHLARAGAIDQGELLEPASDALLHRRALRCLSDRAAGTLALGWLMERQLDRRRINSILVPFDHEPVAKILVRAAQARGIPVLALQHGYEPRKSFHPGEICGTLGAWSQWDLEALPAERQPHARVVGNTGLGSMASKRPVRGEPLHAVIIVEHSLRFTTLIDRRITARHLAVALDGLRRSGRRWRITVRPHPADDVAEFQALAAQLGGTPIDVDAESPILDLLSSADVCIGAVSTASLQTALTDTRLVMLMPERIDCVPPLDGSAGLLFATDAAGLDEALYAALNSSELPGIQDLLEALGHGSVDPVGSTLRWLQELVDQAAR